MGANILYSVEAISCRLAVLTDRHLWSIGYGLKWVLLSSLEAYSDSLRNVSTSLKCSAGSCLLCAHCFNCASSLLGILNRAPMFLQKKQDYWSWCFLWQMSLQTFSIKAVPFMCFYFNTHILLKQHILPCSTKIVYTDNCLLSLKRMIL